MTKTKSETMTGKMSNKISPLDSKHVLKVYFKFNRKKIRIFDFYNFIQACFYENWPPKSIFFLKLFNLGHFIVNRYDKVGGDLKVY